MTSATRLRRAICIMVLAVPMTALARQQPPRTPSGISGVVVTADDSSRPVRQAVVKLTPVDSTGTAAWWDRTVSEFPATLTDDEGRFAFTGLPPGRYRVSVSKPAFLTTEFGALRPGEVGTAVAVTNGAVIPDLSIRLIRGAVISGILRNPDGLPAVNMAVVVTRSGSSGARTASTTDERGVYRVFGLPAGDYLVSSWLISTFSPGEPSTTVTVAEVDAALAALQRRFGSGRPAADATLPATGRTAQSNDTTLPPFRPIQTAPTFYPGTLDEKAAIPVRVSAAEMRDNVDFQFVLGGTVEVAGVVHLPDGRPAAGAIVTINVGRTTSAGADGTFRIAGVSPGRQTLSARRTTFSAAVATGQPLASAVVSDPSSSETALWALEDVDVPASGLSNVNVTLRPGMTLSGRVVFDATSLAPPKDFAAVHLRLVASGVSGAPQIRADGSFDIRGIVPGPSQITGTVAASPPPGWWLRSAVLAGRDLLDLPFEFSASTGDVRGVVVTFSDRHTEISGRLETPEGSPASAYFVAAVASDRRLWHPQSRRLVFTRPATDGRFSFRDLPPGTYTILALSDIDPATWRSPAFLEPILGAGVEVLLPEGGQVVQILRIAK